MKKKKQRRVYQRKIWEAAKLYCREADKCFTAKAYLSTIIARGAELEALLRIYDLVYTTRSQKRCRDLFCLINRAFKKHWIPHDALSYWKRTEGGPLKPYLHWVREMRNGVHAHLLDKRWVNRKAARDIGIIVHAMYSFIETRNARSLMKRLYERGDISIWEYNAWKKGQIAIGSQHR